MTIVIEKFEILILTKKIWKNTSKKFDQMLLA